MVLSYISIAILTIVTITIFFLLRKLNQSIETLTFMIGKFADINQGIYEKQKHINKTMGENLEKQNKQIIELNTYRREMDRMKNELDDTFGNGRKLLEDINTANRKYTDNINTLGNKINKMLSEQNKRKQ